MWADIGTGKADSKGPQKRRAHDDAIDASREVKRRQQSSHDDVWRSLASPLRRRPRHRVSKGVSSPSAPRSQPRPQPAESTAVAATGGPQAASSGRLSGLPREKRPLEHRSSSSTANSSIGTSASPHGEELSSTAHQLPKTAVSSFQYGFRPADRTTGVVGNESNSSGNHRSESGGGGYTRGTRPARYAMEFEIDDSSGNDNNEDDVDRLGGLPAKANSPVAQSSTEGIPKTPSGKPYNMLRNKHGDLERVNGALFPDGYQLQQIRGLLGFEFICPVRDCRKLFINTRILVSHFGAAHYGCHFIDNLDQDGTLTVKERLGSGRSIIVSQRPLDSNAPALKSPSLPKSNRRPDQQKPAQSNRIEKVHDINDAAYNPKDLTEPKSRAPPTRHQSERSTLTVPNISVASNVRSAKPHGVIPLETLSVDEANIKSDVWTYIKPFVKKRWLASFQSELERSAFLQAITLTKRNKMDREWLSGNQKSHQKIFRALLSIVIYVVGVKATCNVCDNRTNTRKRNCMVLPPEAEGMRELQEAVGRKCVNCFFFPSSQDCKVAGAGLSSVSGPIEANQTPMAVQRSPPTSGAMLESRPVSDTATDLSTNIVSQPTPKGLTKAPVLPLRPQASRPDLLQAGLPAEESNGSPVRRTGLRSAKTMASEVDTYVDIVNEPGKLNSSYANSDDVTSRDEPASATTAPSSVSGAPTDARAVVSKAFTLFGEITQLPSPEQSMAYSKIATMLEMASRMSSTTGAAAPGDHHRNVSRQSQFTAAEWEIAPGRLISGGEPVAFSTSSLRREVATLEVAQYITPTEKALNKHIAALEHLRIKPEANWDCKFSVTKGLVKAKMGGIEANIGYGGVCLVKRACVVTNVLHDESHIQVWWRYLDE